MYKDKTKQKEANRIANKRYRDKKGITQEGITGQTRIEFIQKELNDDYLVEGIEGAATVFKDRDIRYERAYKYYLWRKGQKWEPDKGTLAKLWQIKEALGKYVDGVNYGTRELKSIFI